MDGDLSIDDIKHHTFREIHYIRESRRARKMGKKKDALPRRGSGLEALIPK